GHNVADARIQQTTANILGAFLNGAPVAQALKVTAPSSATAGQAFTTTVAAVNAQGNPATTYTGTLHFSSSDPAAVLPADYTFTTGTGGDNGTHQFQGVALKTAGTQTITATDTKTGAITGSATVTVGPAAAASLTLSGLTSATAGTAQSATVTAKDAYGNLATGYGGTVAFNSSDAGASLPANYTFVPADNGAHTFVGGVTLKTAGTQTVTATDAGTSSVTGNQSVTISAGPLASLALSPASATVTAGGSQGYTATGADQYGNSLGDLTASTSFSI